VSVKVTNTLSVLDDHGAYWSNGEEVLTRLAAEIDHTYYRESPFWAGNTLPNYTNPRARRAPRYAAPTEMIVREAVRRRRGRVIQLALARALFIVLWLTLIWRDAATVDVWVRAHSDQFPLPGWISTLLTSLIHLPQLEWFLSTQGALASWITHGHGRNLLSCLVAGLLLGIPVLVLFLGAGWVWSRWNDDEQHRAIARIAEAA
jgi:hypothetical protein